MISKKIFRDHLKTIAQIKIELANLDKERICLIEDIKEKERDLQSIRCDIIKMEQRLINRCDLVFNEVYNQLPDEDNQIIKQGEK